MGDNLIGHVLNGRYEIQKPLGEDKEEKKDRPACVFEAYDSGDDCQVVVKVIEAKYTWRLDAKIRSIAGLKHPHILPICDWGIETIDGVQRFYLVMPLAQGGSLEDRLKKGRLSLAETERILKEICAALGYAHGRQVLHLGLKPSNVLFDEDRVLVADFGLADLIQKTTHPKVNTDSVAQNYLSPEQLSGGLTGPFSDIYAVGIMFHQMVTGEPLKQEKTDEGLSVHRGHSVPAGIRSVIERTRQKDPYLRYHTTGDLAQDFTTAIAQGKKDRQQVRLDAIALITAIIACIVAVIEISGIQPPWPSLKRSTPTLTPIAAPPTATWTPTATPTLMPSPTLTLTPTPSPTPYASVIVEQAHVRAGPGEDYDELGTVQRGDQLPLCGRLEDGTWLQVDYLGMKGWLPLQAVKTSIEPALVPIVKAPPALMSIPMPPTTPSLPGPNTAVRLQNPGFQRVQENDIPGWRWWAEDNYDDKTCRSDPCFDTPSFSQTNDPARMIDGATLQVQATAFVGLKVYILQTVGVSPTVPLRFQASAKAYCDLGGIRLAAGIEPNGSSDCSQARWGDILLMDQSHGTVRLVTPTVAAGQAGRVTVCLHAESVYPAHNNAAFFDNAVLIANPE